VEVNGGGSLHRETPKTVYNIRGDSYWFDKWPVAVIMAPDAFVVVITLWRNVNELQIYIVQFVFGLKVWPYFINLLKSVFFDVGFIKQKI
jgi:hypothetical protein